MSLLNELVSGGTDCLGTNPLTGLGKQFNDASLVKRGLQFEHPAEASSSQRQPELRLRPDGTIENVRSTTRGNEGRVIMIPDISAQWQREFAKGKFQPSTYSDEMQEAFKRAQIDHSQGWLQDFRGPDNIMHPPLGPHERQLFEDSFRSQSAGQRLQPADQVQVDSWIQDFANTRISTQDSKFNDYLKTLSSTSKPDQWAKEFSKAAESHDSSNMQSWVKEFAENAESNMFESEFAKALERDWTEEFEDFKTNNPGIQPSPAAQAIFDKYKDTVVEGSSSNRQRQETIDSWVEQYRANTSHLSQQPIDVEWDQLDKRWGEMGGYNQHTTTHLASRYEFNPVNPFLTDRRSEIEEVVSGTRQSTLSDLILALEASLQFNHDNAARWTQLGILQQENEQDVQAIAAFKYSVEVQPTYLDAYIPLAVSYTNEVARNEAFEALESWIIQHPVYGPGIPQIASTSADRHERLSAMYTEAARMKPEEEMDANVQIGLGVLFNVSEEYEKAVDCFEAALAKQPQDHVLWNKLGATLANSGQTSRAIETYFQALSLNPSYVRARYNLAISYINMGGYREAAEHLVTALGIQQGTTTPASSTHQGVESTNVWNTLKMAALLMDRNDIVKICDDRAFDALKGEFLLG